MRWWWRREAARFEDLKLEIEDLRPKAVRVGFRRRDARATSP
jgi:hypothetical protein